jgi:hypothetical protein
MPFIHFGSPTSLISFSDILSFYKEEIAGESSNRISMLAAGCQSESKMVILKDLFNEVISADNDTSSYLQKHHEASLSYSYFRKGYL